MKKTVTYFAICLSITTPDVSAFADFEADETIVVTGTKTPKLLNNSPVDVHVVDNETIELVSRGTLVDVLDLIPGVVVTQNQKDGYTVLMNGFDSKHVLVLVDGLPLVAPTGSAVDLDQLSAANIAQVEVVRGPASVLYGSSAMGGVINIVTNRAPSKSQFSYQVGSYTGNHSELDSDAQALNHTLKFSGAQVVGNVTTRAQLQHIRYAAIDYNPEDVSQNAAAIDKTFITLDASTPLPWFNSFIKFQRFEENKAKALFQHTALGTNYYRSEVEQTQFEFKFDDPNSFWFVQGRQLEHAELSGNTTGPRTTDIAMTQLSGQKSWQSGSMNPKTRSSSGAETVLGFDFGQDELAQQKLDGTIEINDEQRHDLESFIQHNSIFKNRQYLFGLRLQNDSDFGWYSAFRVSGMWKLGKASNPTKLRLGIGEGYRVPDLKERHYYFDHSNLGYIVIGNDDLVPEESVGLTGSVSHKFSMPKWDLDLDLSGHYSQVEQLIETQIDAQQSASQGIQVSQYVNIDEATVAGFDLASTLSFQDWQWQFTYSYVDAEDGNSNRLSNRPRHQIKTNLNHDFPQQAITASVYLVYQADEAMPEGFAGTATDAYTTVNLRVKQQWS